MLKFVTVFLDFDVRLYFSTLKHLIMHSAFLCMFDDIHSCNYVYTYIIQSLLKKKPDCIFTTVNFFNLKGFLDKPSVVILFIRFLYIYFENNFHFNLKNRC